MNYKRSFSRIYRQMAIGLLLLGAIRVEAVSLDFEETSYTVVPGDEITLNIAFANPIPAGLDAYFIQMNFAEGLFTLTGEDIEVPAELDFGLFEPGAERTVSSDSAAVRGFAEFGAPYQGVALASFTVTVGIDAPAGAQTVTLAIPQGNSFVDGDLNILDDQIVLGTATVMVVVPPPEIAAPILLEPANGNAILSFTGLVGRNYRVEASVDLESWTLIAEVVADGQGEILFEDTSASGFDRRFYRLASQ